MWCGLKPGKTGHITLGNWKASKGLFSGTRKAKLVSVTAAKPVRVFVTSEDNSYAAISIRGSSYHEAFQSEVIFFDTNNHLILESLIL